MYDERTFTIKRRNLKENEEREQLFENHKDYESASKVVKNKKREEGQRPLRFFVRSRKIQKEEIKKRKRTVRI